MKTGRADSLPYVTRDGSLVRELLHPDHHGHGRISLAEALVRPGAGTALHRHLDSEELYHFLEGEGRMTLGKERFAVGPGDTVRILPGVEHRVVNTGTTPLRFLCCCTPPYSHGDTVLAGSGGS